MSDDYFIRLIHKHRFYIILCVLVGTGAALALFWHDNKLQTAISSIYVTPQPELDFQGDVRNVFGQNDALSRNAFAVQQMFLLSNEMDLAIIRRFKLYSRYRIDSTKTYAYEKLVAILNRRMGLKTNPVIPLFELSYKDPNVDFAVDVVNFTVAKLQQMNKAVVVDRLKEKIQLYKLIVTNVNDQSAQISERLADQIKTFSQIVKSNKFDEHEYENLLNFQNSLVALTTNLKSANQTMASANNVYLLAVKSMKDDDFPIVKQMQKAIPKDRDFWSLAFAYGGFGFIVSAILYLSLLYFFSTYKKELSIILRGPE